MIDDCGDAAHRFVVLVGEKRLDGRVFVERVLLEVQQLALMRQERRNPIRIAGVQLPRQLEKLLSLPASTHRLDDDPGGWGRSGKNSQAHGGRQDEWSLNCNSTWICAQNQLSLAGRHDARGWQKTLNDER